MTAVTPIGVTPPAQELPIRAHFGAPGSGKSHELKRLIRLDRPARLIVYDPKREYGSIGRSIDRLSIVWARSIDRTFSIVFHPSTDRAIAERQFSTLCEMAYLRGQLSLVADELASVDRASWSPAGWHKVTREGRHASLRIYCATPRPTEINNGLFSLATTIRTGRLNGKSDRVKLADVLDIDPEEIKTLGPRGWIERDMQTGRLTRGR